MKTAFKLPATWQGRMEAIIAGAVDYDDVEELAMQCAEIADKAFDATAEQRKADAKARGVVDITPGWSVVMDMYLDRWLKWAGGELTEEQSEINDQMIRCGTIADAFLAGSIGKA